MLEAHHAWKKQQRTERCAKQAQESAAKLSLAERLEPPPLYQHPPAGEICNFVKTDLIQKKADVYHRKLDATIEHLNAFYDSFAKYERHLSSDDVQILTWLAATLDRVKKNLNEYAKEYNEGHWKRLNWGLQAIGKVKFVQLQVNYLHIARQLAQIARGNYFDNL